MHARLLGIDAVVCGVVKTTTLASTLSYDSAVVDNVHMGVSLKPSNTHTRADKRVAGYLCLRSWGGEVRIEKALAGPPLWDVATGRFFFLTALAPPRPLLGCAPDGLPRVPRIEGMDCEPCVLPRSS